MGYCKIRASLSGGDRWAVPGCLLCQGFPDAITTGNHHHCHFSNFKRCQIGVSDAAEPSWQQLAQAQTRILREAPVAFGPGLS